MIGTLADWRVGGYIWYREEGTGRAATPPSPRCTKCNSPLINGLCTNFILFDVALYYLCPLQQHHHHHHRHQSSDYVTKEYVTKVFSCVCDVWKGQTVTRCWRKYQYHHNNNFLLAAFSVFANGETSRCESTGKTALIWQSMSAITDDFYRTQSFDQSSAAIKRYGAKSF